MSILATVFFVVLLLLVVRYLWNFETWKKLNRMPAIKGIPIFHNLFYIIGTEEQLFQKLRDMNNLHRENFVFSLPMLIGVFLRDPDDIEALLKSSRHIKKNRSYKFLEPWLGEGLLTSAGTKWQKRRRILTPGFHFNILQKYMQVVLHHAAKTVQDLKDEQGCPVKDLTSWASDCTLNIICETAMGVNFDNRKEDAIKYKNAVQIAGQATVYRTIRPWFISDLIYSLTSAGKIYHESVKILHDFSTNIINERKNFHKSTNDEYLSELKNMESEREENDLNYGKKKNLAMLDILINAYQNNEIDDEGIREEVDTFVFEGYDTTASAMCFSILCLAQNPEIQAKARTEVDKVWQECDGRIGMNEVQKFGYLERCIKEALRLYPSVPIIMREISEDLHLKKSVLPAGTQAFLHIQAIHNDPNLWPHPEVFDPDRFLPENSQSRHPFSYIPFSGGFRNCIGQKFATAELKVVLGFLLHSFVFEAIDKTKDMSPVVDLVMRVKHPLRVKFIPIESQF